MIYEINESFVFTLLLRRKLTPFASVSKEKNYSMHFCVNEMIMNGIIQNMTPMKTIQRLKNVSYYYTNQMYCNMNVRVYYVNTYVVRMKHNTE